MHKTLLAAAGLLAAAFADPAAAQSGPYAPCTPFSGFPLSMNLGRAPTGVGGVTVRCANSTLQTAVNTIMGLRGQANGLAVLGSDGKLPLAQFPLGADLPRVPAALAGPVVADGTSDQAGTIASAAATCPPAGCVLVLPCGSIYLGRPLALTNQNIIVEGGGQYCTTLVSGFATGDVLTLTGNYSGVRDLGFKHQGGAFRISGYTVNLAGAYQFAKGVSFQNCYRCVQMGATAGWARVEDVDMTNLTPDSVSAGSGGITVNNPVYGPNNRIDNVLIYGSAAGAPLAGINIVNSGATQISNSDILGFKVNLLVNPGTDTTGFTRNPSQPSAQTSQALRVSNTYFDSAQGQANVLFLPSGTGYVFDSAFTGTWLTNTSPAVSNGIEISTRASTRTDGTTFRGFVFSAGFIANAGAGNNGIVCSNGAATDSPTDITVTGSLIAGWSQGVNIGCSDGTVSDNRIGAYNPFGNGSNGATNVNGVYLNPGVDRWAITGNRLVGNATAAVNDQSAGSLTRITDNVGFNGSQPATNVTVGASPFTLVNGHAPATFYVNGGTVTSIIAPSGNVALASQSPAAITLGPNERVIVTYTAAPTIARMPH